MSMNSPELARRACRALTCSVTLALFASVPSACGTAGEPTTGSAAGGADTSGGGPSAAAGAVSASPAGSAGSAVSASGAGGSELDGGVGNGESGANIGGAAGASGATSKGGSAGAGGSGAGGMAGAAGSGGVNSGAGAGGGTAVSITGPRDIYESAKTPCVAAHSTVRALYGAYTGGLYQVKRASDGTTQNIHPLAPGGFANTALQTTFCANTTCTIPIIYDQSPQHNDLKVAPKGNLLQNGGKEANATDGKITVGGHTVYGIYVTGNANYQTDRTVQTVAYRNNSTKGLATGDQAEAMYMVLDGKRFSSPCCFDYGNAETSGNDDGNGTMEAIYWGSDTLWAKGGGAGPWVAGDLENGMYKGDSKNTPSNTSITGMAWVTTMLKGPSGNHFALKAGNAASGTLAIKWDGARPTPDYSPKRLQGALILGTGGDGSSGGTGTFYEGAMTIGNPADSVDDAIQANIVAAGYGH
jgi:hypothetical protein